MSSTAKWQFLIRFPASFSPIRCTNLLFHTCKTVRDMKFSQRWWWRLKSLGYDAMSFVSHWCFGRTSYLLPRNLRIQFLLGTWEGSVAVLFVSFILFRHCGESVIVKAVQWRWVTTVTSTLIISPNLLWNLLNVYNGYVSNKRYRGGWGGEQ